MMNMIESLLMGAGRIALSRFLSGGVGVFECGTVSAGGGNRDVIGAAENGG